MAVNLELVGRTNGGQPLRLDRQQADARRERWTSELERAMFAEIHKKPARDGSAPASDGDAPALPGSHEPNAPRSAAAATAPGQRRPLESPHAMGEATPVQHGKRAEPLMAEREELFRDELTKDEPAQDELAMPPDQSAAGSVVSAGAIAGTPSGASAGETVGAAVDVASLGAGAAATSSGADYSHAKADDHNSGLDQLPVAGVAAVQVASQGALSPGQRVGVSAASAQAQASSVAATAARVAALAMAPTQSDVVADTEPAPETIELTELPDVLDQVGGEAPVADADQYTKRLLHVYQDRHGVHAFIRDAELGQAQARTVAFTMAGEFAAAGKTLAALTVNGKRVVTAHDSDATDSHLSGQALPGSVAPVYSHPDQESTE